MKITIRNINILLILAMVIPIIAIPCNDDDSSTANLSFSQSIYILPSTGSLEVELRASVTPEIDLIVPVNVEGTAEPNEDYRISAKKFIIKAGKTNGILTLAPKNNLISRHEVRLSVDPVGDYELEDRKIAIVPIETKERITYSFVSSYSRVLSSVGVWVELQGEINGKSFRAPYNIVLPLEVSSSSTTELGTDFTMPTSIAIPKDGRQTYIILAIQEDAEDYVSRAAIVSLKVPTRDDPDFYYAGSFITYSLKLDQVRSINMLGKRKPVKIVSEDNYIAYEVPDEDMINLPENNGENDYPEFVHIEGNDIITPHLNGDLKDSFSSSNGHKVVFDHIKKGLIDWGRGIEYDALYYKIFGVNTLFSFSQTKIGDVMMGTDEIDDNNIIIYFHEYIPTDFFIDTYDLWGLDAEVVGVNYTLTRIVE